MKKGTFWIIAGILCILGAAGLTIYNLYDSARAGKAAQSVLGKVQAEVAEPIPMPDRTINGTSEKTETQTQTEIQYPDYVLDPTREMPAVEIDGIDYVGVLEIPALDMTLPVASEWDYWKLETAPCRYTGTAYMGDLIICAHNYFSHFGELKNLTIGDSVAFTDMDGNCFEYEVVEIEILGSDAVEEMTAGDWDLTLFTCTIGGRTRVTVRCEGKNK